MQTARALEQLTDAISQTWLTLKNSEKAMQAVSKITVVLKIIFLIETRLTNFGLYTYQLQS